MSLPTLADLKSHLNKSTTDTADDAELIDMLDAAVEVVEGIVGPITATTVTETHNAYGDSLILRRVPVADLVSVAHSGAPVLLDELQVDPDSGLVRRLNGYGFVGTFTVAYSVGRPNVPASIRVAILIIAAHLWETQRMPGMSMDSAPAGFGGADGIPDMGNTGSGFAIPRRAEELLRAYMPGPVMP